MSYSAIDYIIEKWAMEHELKLCYEFADREARFCYVSGGWKECFQVSIEPPSAVGILVNAWSIETQDDAELHDAWFVSADKLEEALRAALERIEDWKARFKGDPTW